MEDKRNVIDKFKGRSELEIINELDSEDHGLVIALENTERDFNMGTIAWAISTQRLRDKKRFSIMGSVQ